MFDMGRCVTISGRRRMQGTAGDPRTTLMVSGPAPVRLGPGVTFGGADGPGYGTNWDRRRSAWGRRDVLGRRRPPYGMTRLRLGGAWSAWAMWRTFLRLAVLAVVPPEAVRLLGRGGVTTSGGPARSQPKHICRRRRCPDDV